MMHVDVNGDSVWHTTSAGRWTRLAAAAGARFPARSPAVGRAVRGAVVWLAGHRARPAGQGRSEVPPGPYTMDQHADDLAALAGRAWASQRAVIGGLSMGGIRDVRVLAPPPPRVRALVLADTRAEPDSEGPRATAMRLIRTVRKAGSAAYAEEMMPRVLAPASMADERIVRGRAAHDGGTTARRGHCGAARHAATARTARRHSARITVPLLVVAGARRLTPPADAQSNGSAIPGARWSIIPARGPSQPLGKPVTQSTRP